MADIAKCSVCGEPVIVSKRGITICSGPARNGVDGCGPVYPDSREEYIPVNSDKLTVEADISYFFSEEYDVHIATQDPILTEVNNVKALRHSIKDGFKYKIKNIRDNDIILSIIKVPDTMILPYMRDPSLGKAVLEDYGVPYI